MDVVVPPAAVDAVAERRLVDEPEPLVERGGRRAFAAYTSSQTRSSRSSLEAEVEERAERVARRSPGTCRPGRRSRSRGRQPPLIRSSSWRSSDADRAAVEQPADDEAASGRGPGGRADPRTSAPPSRGRSGCAARGCGSSARPRASGRTSGCRPLGRPEVDEPAAEHRTGGVGRLGGHPRSLSPRQAPRQSTPRRTGPSSLDGSNASSRNGDGRERVVDERQRAAGARPGDVGEAALLLEGPVAAPATRPRSGGSGSGRRPCR